MVVLEIVDIEPENIAIIVNLLASPGYDHHINHKWLHHLVQYGFLIVMFGGPLIQSPRCTKHHGARPSADGWHARLPHDHHQHGPLLDKFGRQVDVETL